ncbi:succinylglutamate desuccinylase/aspartoacylase family protein [Bradyrhizobium sp. LHD-71]|uniref:succinylglutamate desuccinylase/aspartoacylase family protein n=1 Tax=Bradyrhizobium sp. LHD-71 TaxID=3072141 RepID=UPI00280F3CF2|nr:succinylglutamate desuccinylase/aspartoacylase family protein [Bradyrhizobium sp. LHD-71]MDQ8732072.1 succinylglutamate desuccinylase/aspartoacylase family protein [Bradyrhizobium sp. LHD-71]
MSANSSAIRWAVPNVDDAPLESVRFHGLKTGPKLIVVGAVHGNETCGPNAIVRAIDDCRAGRLVIRRGEVTFVPVANAKAYRQNTREGDRNLNRDLRERPLPVDNEDRIGNPLTALLRQHDVLLDIHSFRGEGKPFVFFGPEDNAGELEAFRHATAEAAFAACLGTDILIHGWLDIYVALIAARERLALPPLAVTEGFGTTEYMRFAGGYGVTLECGQHDDPAAADIGHAAIHNALVHLGIAVRRTASLHSPMVDAALPARRRPAVIHMNDLVICETPGDKLEGQWRTGDSVTAGQPVARRVDGELVSAPRDGYIIFPNANAKLGEAICYLGVRSARGA